MRIDDSLTSASGGTQVAEAPRLAPTLPRTPRVAKIAPARARWIERGGLIVAAGIIFYIAVYLLTVNIALPWHSKHEDNGNFFETTAINHIRYGFDVTKGQDLLDLGPGYSYGYGPSGLTESQQFARYVSGPVQTQVYGDHPPLLSITIAGFFSIFGYHYWAERLVVILYALAGLGLFFLLVRRLAGPFVALAASAFYATFPIFDYYGRDVSHESPTLFWGLALMTGYFYWRETHQRRWSWLMVAAIGIGGFYGWPMFYFAVLLFAIDWAIHRRFDRALLARTVVPAVVTFALVLGQLIWALNGDVGHVISLFLFRSSSGTSYGASAWLRNIYLFNIEDYGKWSLYVLLPALGFLVWRIRAEGWSRPAIMTVICAAWGVSHILIFREGAYLHDYWQFYLIPFYSVLYGWTLVFAASWLLKSAPQAREPLARYGHVLAPVAMIAGVAMLSAVLLKLGLSSTHALYTFRHNPYVPLLSRL